MFNFRLDLCIIWQKGKTMLKRKVQKLLDEWLKGKNALLVDGARQVGKSFSIRQFAKNNFSDFVELNLRTSPDLIPVLNSSKTSADLLLRLKSLSPHPLKKGSLFFIDEIQEAKDCDLITLSKSLVEEGSYRYIFSGSLLGVTLNNINSYPVGYLDEIKMYPLDFEEFLWAFQKDDETISYLRNCFFERKPVDNFIHERLIKILEIYVLVGGMPEAVNEFLKSEDLKASSLVQKAIVTGYEQDIKNHVNQMTVGGKKEGLALKLSSIFEQIPEQINSKDKRFKIKSVISNRSQSQEVEDDFNWLTKADVAIPVFNVSEPTNPLTINVNRRLLKLFSSDVGLLSYQLLPTGVMKAILSNSENVNYGAVYENFVAEELHSHGFNNLYYYSNKKFGELDFIINGPSGIMPIEIKSGKDYKRHVALDNLLKEKNYGIKEGFVFSKSNFKKEGNIVYYPLYLLDFLRNEPSDYINTKLDLSSLMGKD